MKFFFISEKAHSIALATKIQSDGHEVCFYIHDKHSKQIGDGYVKKVNTISEGVKDADYIIVDSQGFGSVVDKLKQAGKKVWGGGSFEDKLNNDKVFVDELIKQTGIIIPKTFEFNNKSDAIQFLSKEHPRYILKSPVVFHFIPESNEYLAKYIEAEALLNNTKIVLQEYPDGVDVATNIFYTNGHRLYNPFWVLETKRFLPHNLGLTTDSMTNLVGVYSVKEPRLYQLVLKKLEFLFEKMKLNSCVSINVVVDKNGNIYFSDLSTQLGRWFYAYCCLLDMSVAEFLTKLCENSLSEIPTKHKVASSINISVPPFPYQLNVQHSLPVIVKDVDRVFLTGVRFDTNTQSFITCSPLIAEVCEAGNNWREVLIQNYKNTTLLEVANKQFRTDAIRDADYKIKKLAFYKFF